MPDAVPSGLSAAGQKACTDLVDGLPATLSGLRRRAVTPSAALAAAWGDPPVVVTCGGEVPAEFDDTASCLTVNGVDWFTPGEELTAPSGDLLTLTAVNRDVTVELRFPLEHWPPATALAELSAPVKASTTATGHCS